MAIFASFCPFFPACQRRACAPPMPPTTATAFGSSCANAGPFQSSRTIQRESNASIHTQAYKLRNLIERMFRRLKDWRRIATRYDKLARNYLASVNIAAFIMVVQLSLEPSTTLADLFTLLLFADLSSAVRASLRSWSNDEFDDGVAYGRQARLRRRPVDSFFSAPLVRVGDAGGTRRRSLS